MEVKQVVSFVKNPELRKNATLLLGQIDRLFLEFDWWLLRAYSERKRNLVLLHPPGHAWVISWLAILMAVFIISGPNLGNRGWAAAFLILGSIILSVILYKLIVQERWLLWVQLSVLLVLSVLVFCILTDASDVEQSTSMYRHIIIPLFWTISIGLLFAKWLAWWLLDEYRGRFSSELRNTELFHSAGIRDIDIPSIAYWRSLATAPLYYPHYLFLFVAFFAISIPDPEQMKVWAFYAFFCGWLFMAAADVHERLRGVIEFLRGIFFVGGQLLVSLAVIGLGAGRLFDVQYVKTIIEVGDTNVNMHILLYVITAYCFFWFYEYWTNRIIGEKVLLAFVGEEDTPCDTCESGRVPYHINEGAITSDVKLKRRCIQIHGGGRFAVVGYSDVEIAGEGEKTIVEKLAYRFYNRARLIDTVINPVDYTEVQRDASRLEKLDYAGLFKQRIRFYFTIINLVLAIFLYLLMSYAYDLPKKAELIASVPTAEQKKNLFDLQQKLFEKRLPNNSAIAFSASGGGTRAALYAQSILEGLYKEGALDNVVLVSGVSGGSAALAYFSAHQDDLKEGAGWKRFNNVMSFPFIQDVIDGVVEWRIAAGEYTKNGDDRYRHKVRLGELLAESFENHFYKDETKKNNQLMGSSEVGIILNTSLAAKFPRWECDKNEPLSGGDTLQTCACNDKLPLALREKQCPELLTNAGEGGRLIMTNLKNAGAFPNEGIHDAPHEYLDYVVLQDPNVKLSTAAALSANFPPVFSNAAIDVDNRTRYWVTDGGASDNRGVISLLYALKDAIDKELKLKKEGREGRYQPDIYVVVGEASAVNMVYTSNRGVGAKMASSARFASQLMVDLVRHLEESYAKMGGRFVVRYLSMPLVMRSHGGLGTHWMLPARVTYRRSLQKSTLDRHVSTDDNITLNSETTRALMTWFHQPQLDNSLLNNEEVRKLISWVKEDNVTCHGKVWQLLIASLKSKSEPSDTTSLEGCFD